MCSQPHQLAYLFPEVQVEMIILTLHFSYRGRHSGKGPAAVSNQSKVVMQWKTDYVSCLRKLDEELCILSEKGSYILQIITVDTRFLSIIFETGICKMHVIVGNAVLVCILLLYYIVNTWFCQTSITNKHIIVIFPR